MSAYMIIAWHIFDEAKWTQYRDSVMPLIAKFGGRHLTKGSDIDTLEGPAEPSWTIVLFEFPTVDVIRAFWNSLEYRPVEDIRRDAAALNIWAIQGK